MILVTILKAWTYIRNKPLERWVQLTSHAFFGLLIARSNIIAEEFLSKFSHDAKTQLLTGVKSKGVNGNEWWKNELWNQS